MDISFLALNPKTRKEASGPYEVTLNGEPFHVEMAVVEADAASSSKSVVFFSPKVELYQRVVSFTIPLGAKPGTYVIETDNPEHKVSAGLQEIRHNSQPGPDDPLGWVTWYISSKGSMQLIKWDQQILHMRGDFEFEVRIGDQQQYIKATFDLTEIK